MKIPFGKFFVELKVNSMIQDEPRPEKLDDKRKHFIEVLKLTKQKQTKIFIVSIVSGHGLTGRQLD